MVWALIWSLEARLRLETCCPLFFLPVIACVLGFRDPEEGSEQDRDCQADTAAVIQRERMSHMKFAKRMDRFGEGIFSKLAEIKKEKDCKGERSSISA